MKSTTITLGGQEYELKPLTLRPAREFRQKLTEYLDELVKTVGAVDGTDLADFDQVAALIRTIGGAALGSVDQLAEWLFEYSPELAADRERIEDEAFDDEIVATFLEVLKQLFPFGAVTKSLTGLMAQAISTNSPSPSGVAGRTNSTKRR